MTARRFAESLRVTEARIVVADPDGGVRPVRQMPATDGSTRAGPSFVIASREFGAAGMAELSIATQSVGAGKGETVFRETVMITDGPTVFAPGLVNTADLAGRIGFELRHRSSVLGSVSFRPVPAASFDGEGGYKMPPHFQWTTGADDELADRLSKLTGEGGG